MDASFRLPPDSSRLSINQSGGLEKQSKTTETEATETTPLKGQGLSRPDSVLGGRSISVRQLPPEQDIGVQRDQSQERIQKLNFGKKALNALATLVALPFKLAATTVGTVGGLVFGGIGMVLTKAKEACFGLSEAKQERENVRNTLGQPKAGGVMSQQVTYKDGDGTKTGSVSGMMEAYRQMVGGDKRISSDMMTKYINMGEKIMDALNDPGYQTGQPLSVNGTVIKPNLETTRAISWFLQAKSLVDNAGPNADPPHLVSGSMVAKDPGNKLHDFLASSNNAYGRVSSHFAERSDSVDRGWLGGLKALFNGGFFAAGGAGLSGQPLQHGIEDFGNKMPSGGGTLLFDKLKGKDGNPEILMKWEEVGTPTAFSFTKTHADDADGFAQKMWNRGQAALRCFEHTVHFAGNADPAGYRGEKVDKGPAKNLFKAFETLVDNANLSRNEAKAVLSHVKSHGIDAMKEELVKLPGSPQGLQLAQQIASFEALHGADLGIARKGGEVHVNLS